MIWRCFSETSVTTPGIERQVDKSQIAGRSKTLSQRVSSGAVETRICKTTRWSISLNYSSDYFRGRDGGTGRRSGLKIRRYLVPWGFDSPSRHQSNPLRGHQLGRTRAPERRCSVAPFSGIFGPIVPELCPNSFSSDAADFC